MSSVFMSALAKEIAEEKAQGLGHAERTMKAALEEYRRFTVEPTAGATRCEREALLWGLTTSLASFIIQREACGLTDTDRVLKLYGIPAEAVARLGARPRAAAAAC
jgi:hypothetical protein